MFQAMDAYRVVWEIKFPRHLPYSHPHQVRRYEGTIALACQICVWWLRVSRGEDVIGLQGGHCTALGLWVESLEDTAGRWDEKAGPQWDLSNHPTLPLA